MRQLSRRDFANRAVVAATGLAAATAVQGAEAPRRRSKIRIGVRFNEAWLNSKNDEDLKPWGGGRAGWSREQGRGGYGYPTFNLKRAQAEAPKPRYKVTRDQLWKGLINIYKQVVPTVEGSKTVIAMHGNDPPLPEHLGSPQIICRYATSSDSSRKCRASTTG